MGTIFEGKAEEKGVKAVIGHQNFYCGEAGKNKVVDECKNNKSMTNGLLTALL